MIKFISQKYFVFIQQYILIHKYNIQIERCTCVGHLSHLIQPTQFQLMHIMYIYILKVFYTYILYTHFKYSNNST